MPAAGFPLKVAVPLLCGAKVTPLGRVPAKLMVDFGTELRVATVKLFATPTTKVALLTLVKAAGREMTSTKFCVAAGSTPFEAVKIRG